MTKRKDPRDWDRLGRPAKSFHDKVLRHVVKTPTGCWQWTAKIYKGYGISHNGRRPCQAHRLCYEKLIGKIPAGLQLDHLCRNKACVNPKHLEPVTASENILRAIRALRESGEWNRKKSHCHKGHPRSGENLRVDSDGRGWCRMCERDRWQTRKAAMHAAQTA